MGKVRSPVAPVGPTVTRLGVRPRACAAGASRRVIRPSHPGGRIVVMPWLSSCINWLLCATRSRSYRDAAARWAPVYVPHRGDRGPGERAHLLRAERLGTAAAD